MKKFWFICFLMVVLLSGCGEMDTGEPMERTYPYINYRNSSFNFDPLNREIPVEEEYVLNEGHSFDVVETDEGYDVVLHFIKETDGENNASN